MKMFWSVQWAILVLFLNGMSHSHGQTRTLRVLAYNIYHGEGMDKKIDLPRLAKVIKSTQPDLVALQEVDHINRRTGMVDQTAELAKLTGMHGRFGRQIDFMGGQYGQSVLSRFPLGESTIHILPGTPVRETRIAFEVVIKDPAGEISFVSTHLHHNNNLFREQQATKLNEIFEKVSRPVILAGDLNANPGSKPVGILLTEWKNTTSGTDFKTYPSQNPKNQIDYVLVRPKDKFRVLETRVIPEEMASDHRPLLAVLELVP